MSHAHTQIQHIIPNISIIHLEFSYAFGRSVTTCDPHGTRLDMLREDVLEVPTFDMQTPTDDQRQKMMALL